MFILNIKPQRIPIIQVRLTQVVHLILQVLHTHLSSGHLIKLVLQVLHINLRLGETVHLVRQVFHGW